MLKHLDLFSGIGGWTLGFHATEEIETVGFCEIEKYPQQILKQNYPGTPIFKDVRKLDYEQLRTAGLISDTQRIDILTCSYPCQPFSVAGKKRGEEDPRHLWPEVHRLIRDDRIRPMYVLGENVGGHIRQGLDTVSEDMERCGYRWRCFSIEASCIGANHRRQRVWWIAEDMANTYSGHSKGKKREVRTRGQASDDGSTGGGTEDVADSKGKQRQRELQDGKQKNGEKKKRGKSDRRGSQPSNRSTDVADSKNKGLQGRKRNSQGKGRQVLSSEPHNRSKIRSNTRCASGVPRETKDVANTNSRRRTPIIETRGSNKKNKRRQDHIEQSSTVKDVADSNSKRRSRRNIKGQNAEDVGQSSKSAFTRNWDIEPNVGRVANGVSNRVHRLKALGNAIVPQMAYYIGQALIKDFQHKNHN